MVNPSLANVAHEIENMFYPKSRNVEGRNRFILLIMFHVFGVDFFRSMMNFISKGSTAHGGKGNVFGCQFTKTSELHRSPVEE